MPIFEYQCQACGNIFEKIRSTPQEKENCPRCTAPADRRVSLTAQTSSISAPSMGGCGGGGFS